MQSHGSCTLPDCFLFGSRKKCPGYAFALGLFRDGDRFQMRTGFMTQRFGAQPYQRQPLYHSSIIFGNVHETIICIAGNPFAKQGRVVAPQMFRDPGFRQLEFR